MSNPSSLPHHCVHCTKSHKNIKKNELRYLKYTYPDVLLDINDFFLAFSAEEGFDDEDEDTSIVRRS